MIPAMAFSQPLPPANPSPIGDYISYFILFLAGFLLFHFKKKLRKNIPIGILLILCFNSLYAQKNIYIGSSGLQYVSDGNNWSLGRMPMANDTLIINPNLHDSLFLFFPSADTVIQISQIQCESLSSYVELIIPESNTSDSAFIISSPGSSFIGNVGLSNYSGSSSGQIIYFIHDVNFDSASFYRHATPRAHAAILNQILFDDHSTFILKVPGTAGYSLSLTGRTFGNFRIENNGSFKAYTSTGTSPFKIINNFFIDTLCALTFNLNNNIEIGGDLTGAGVFTYNPSTSGTRKITFTKGNNLLIGYNQNFKINDRVSEIKIESDTVYWQGNFELGSACRFNHNGILFAQTKQLNINGLFEGSGQWKFEDTLDILNISGNSRVDTLPFYNLIIVNSSTINSSSSNIYFNTKLEIHNKLHIQNGQLYNSDTIVLKAKNACNYAVLLGQDSLNSILNMEYYFSGSAGWRMISSPLKLSLTNLNQNINLNLSDSINRRIFKWSAGQSEWVYPNSLNDSFNSEIAYMVYFFSTDINKKMSFCGYPVKSYQPKLKYDSSANSSAFVNGIKDGWNLISNPFLSPLDWSLVKANIGGNINQYHYLWNSTDTGYLFHNGNSGSDSLNGLLSPFQAFFIKLGAASDTSATCFNFNSALLSQTKVPHKYTNRYFLEFKSTKSKLNYFNFNISEDGEERVSIQKDAFFMNGNFQNNIAIKADSVFIIQKNIPVNFDSLDYDLAYKFSQQEIIDVNLNSKDYEILVKDINGKLLWSSVSNDDKFRINGEGQLKLIIRRRDVINTLSNIPEIQNSEIFYQIKEGQIIPQGNETLYIYNLQGQLLGQINQSKKIPENWYNQVLIIRGKNNSEKLFIPY